MIPAVAGSGSSFKGAAAYYLHDKDADTRERIAWTHTENLLTNDPEKAWKVMAWTAMHQGTLKKSAGVKATGQKLKAPVYAFSISWHPEQKPDKAHMLATMRQALANLGMADHQAIFVCHNDEPHPHVHAMVNRVHPVTGKAASIGKDWEKFQAMALHYERQHGKIYCPAREKNARGRVAPKSKQGREGNPVIESAWSQSDNGRSFQAALKAQGFTLAQGNRRFVVVDPWGKAHNPVRYLPTVRAAEFKARLADLDIKTLPTAAAVQKAVRIEERKEYHATREFERWSADYLNTNQSRQIEERAAMHAHYAKALADKKEDLAKEYNLAELQKKIDALRNPVARPSLMRRMTGAAANDRAELVAQERQLADVERRTGERLGAIVTERDLALTDLAGRHKQEMQAVQEMISERKLAGGGEKKTRKNQPLGDETHRRSTTAENKGPEPTSVALRAAVLTQSLKNRFEEKNLSVPEGTKMPPAQEKRFRQQEIERDID